MSRIDQTVAIRTLAKMSIRNLKISTKCAQRFLSAVVDVDEYIVAMDLPGFDRNEISVQQGKITDLRLHDLRHIAITCIGDAGADGSAPMDLKTGE